MKIAVIGAGVMGSAIVESLVREKVFRPSEITAIDLAGHKLAGLKRKFGIKTAAKIPEADIFLLAIKPQGIAALCENFKTDKLVISILAGTRVAKIKQLTSSAKIVRVMPNTPAQVGAGISGWHASSRVTRDEKILVRRILESFGEQAEFKNEKMLDTVTAISGSGPAYFFAFAEALELAAKKLGLGKNAAAFVGETFFGSAKLADCCEIPFAKLRENVTSKGGTTAAALTVFGQAGLNKIVEKAVKAAQKRAEELA
ncbi:MAG: pyrroline-5-carboxylate reductase [Patescibacteria group bacterium]